ncbi:MAG TPA: RluA family pseudouridine synthase [Bacilli bacterium]|nr:RluA family pseudouridine synthase [Bacilli bacterium]
MNILYEDNHLIVAMKPKGILSQSDNTKDPDMLTLLKDYIKKKYNKPGNVYLGLVHRLDRPTAGIMVFARTSKAAKRLSEEIKNGEFTKKYLALVHGKFKEKAGELEDYIYKDENHKMAFITTSNKGKYAHLEYKVIKEIGNNTLVDITLKTGRFHQIRVQFNNINHPLVGDHKYGNDNTCDLMLYAYHLEFNHPITKERMVFDEYKEDLC